MITDTMIAYGDQLGAQMSTFANLYYLAKENQQELVFVEELKNFRRGYQMLDAFDLSSIRMIKRSNHLQTKVCELYCRQFEKNATAPWQARMKRIYHSWFKRKADRIFHMYIRHLYRDFQPMKGLQSGVHCDERLLRLDENASYDIQDGFGTCQDWDKYGEELIQLLRFRDDVREVGETAWKEMNIAGQCTVSVHFRRTDYLVLASLNLSQEYYRKALSLFDKERVTFVVFSDDIEGVKELDLFEGAHVIYMPPHPAAVDMYLMTKCDHNIIANSTFSFWGAWLNPKADKRVLCPHDFIGEKSPELMYLNGAWIPQNWESIDAL